MPPRRRQLRGHTPMVTWSDGWSDEISIQPEFQLKSKEIHMSHEKKPSYFP